MLSVSWILIIQGEMDAPAFLSSFRTTRYSLKGILHQSLHCYHLDMIQARGGPCT